MNLPGKGDHQSNIASALYRLSDGAASRSPPSAGVEAETRNPAHMTVIPVESTASEVWSVPDVGRVRHLKSQLSAAVARF